VDVLQSDVLIVGAGPSGSYLAMSLLKSGVSVTIIDKAVFPREKLCGGLVTHKTMEVLKEAFESAGDYLEGETFSDMVRIFHKGNEISGIRSEKAFRLVNRSAFDAHLLSDVKKCGAVVYEGESVESIDPENGILRTKSRTFRYRTLVGADGANSVVRKLIDKGYRPNGFCLEVDIPNAMQDSIDIHFGFSSNSYGWVLPKNNSTTIGVGGSKCKHIRKDFEKLMDDAGFLKSEDIAYTLDSSGKKVISSVAGQKVRGAFIPFGDIVPVPAKSFGGTDVLLVGDAAGLVDPITGEGLYFAFMSSRHAAEAIVSCDGDSVAEAYLDSVGRLQQIVTQGNAFADKFYSPIMQSVAFRLFKGKNRVFEDFCDSFISEYKMTYEEAGDRLKKKLYWRW
jgi:menaquinone-9 beta-reductase